MFNEVSAILSPFFSGTKTETTVQFHSYQLTFQLYFQLRFTLRRLQQPFILHFSCGLGSLGCAHSPLPSALLARGKPSLALVYARIMQSSELSSDLGPPPPASPLYSCTTTCLSTEPEALAGRGEDLVEEQADAVNKRDRGQDETATCSVLEAAGPAKRHKIVVAKHDGAGRGDERAEDQNGDNGAAACNIQGEASDLTRTTSFCASAACGESAGETVTSTGGEQQTSAPTKPSSAVQEEERADEGRARQVKMTLPPQALWESRSVVPVPKKQLYTSMAWEPGSEELFAACVGRCIITGRNARQRGRRRKGETCGVRAAR